MDPQHFESLYPVDTRFSEIETLLHFVKEGKSVQLISLPGGGRSNFLGLLAYNKPLRIHHLKDEQKWFHFVPVDFSEIRKQPLSESYKLIFLELIESLQQRTLLEEYATVKEFLKDALQFQDGLILFQGLKKAIEYLYLEKKLTIILLFDRFEEYLPMLEDDFFTNLRTLRNHAKYRFSVVFSLSKPLEYTLEPLLFADFAEHVMDHTLYLSLYDKKAFEFQIAYLEKVSGKTLTKQQQEEILQITGGHAKLTRLVIERFLADTNETIEQWNNIPIIHHALQTIWNIFNPAEKTHFLKDLFDTQYTDEHTKYLETVGIVKNKHITIPLFQQFVEEQKKSLLVEKSQTLSFDATTNTISQNNDDISEKFTATEFRLLRFFLENPGTVLERNTIIQGVWKDTKTVLGVTDQALDQLIFRLRRKIEEDPNSPTHLQTVKGRGFIFHP